MTKVKTRSTVARGTAWRAWMLAALLAAAFPALADPGTIRGVPTSIKSVADRMISYRFQEHMWQTADGATHVMVNIGTWMSEGALTLYSTFDAGLSWVPSGIALPQSGGASTSDGFLDGDDLLVVYSGKAAEIRFARLRYDPAARTWSLAKRELIYKTSAAFAMTPAIAADAQGRLWLAFTNQDRATADFSIKMMVKPRRGAWSDTGLVFGGVDNLSNERSGRPIATTAGMGMVYSVHHELFWAERAGDSPLTAAWASQHIYTAASPMSDPYGSHYSVVADDASNLHLLSVDGGQLVYSRRLAADDAWQSRVLTEPVKATYVQVVIVQGRVMLITNRGANLAVFESSDGGDTIAQTYSLTHAAPQGAEDYSRPRVEAPSRSASPVPVLQQYFDGTYQGALFFAVPIGAGDAARDRPPK